MKNHVPRGSSTRRRPLAARLLYDAFMNDDIEGKRVADLGCGTGILAIGAALLGARTVRAVDLDPAAVRIAGKNAALLGVDVECIVAGVGGKIPALLNGSAPATPLS